MGVKNASIVFSLPKHKQMFKVIFAYNHCYSNCFIH